MRICDSELVEIHGNQPFCCFLFSFSFPFQIKMLGSEVTNRCSYTHWVLFGCRWGFAETWTHRGSTWFSITSWHVTCRRFVWGCQWKRWLNGSTPLPHEVCKGIWNPNNLNRGTRQVLTKLCSLILHDVVAFSHINLFIPGNHLDSSVSNWNFSILWMMLKATYSRIRCQMPLGSHCIASVH